MTLVPPFHALWHVPKNEEYLHCAVPNCKAHSAISPTKKFIEVPSSPYLRKILLNEVGLDFEPYKNLKIFFCEDHFEVQENSDAYLKYENKDRKRDKLRVPKKTGRHLKKEIQVLEKRGSFPAFRVYSTAPQITSIVNTFIGCFPKCTNTSIKTPEKLFVSVPKDVKVRQKWLQLARRDPRHISRNTNAFFCEDHFDMENDMANYYQYKMGFSKKILLKDKVLPSRFHCQPDRKRFHNDTSRSAFVKQQRMELINQCVDAQQPMNTNNEPTATVVEACTEELPQTIQTCDKNIETEHVEANEKSVQCRLLKRILIRSKAVQTKTVTRDTALSPLKPTVVSSGTSPFKIKKRINFIDDDKSESDVSVFEKKLRTQDSSSLATPSNVSESSTSIADQGDNIGYCVEVTSEDSTANTSSTSALTSEFTKCDKPQMSVFSHKNRTHNSKGLLPISYEKSVSLSEHLVGDGYIGTTEEKYKNYIGKAGPNINQDQKYLNYCKLSQAPRVFEVDDNNYALIDHDYAINSIRLVVKQGVGKKKAKVLYPNNFQGELSKKDNTKVDEKKNAVLKYKCYSCDITFQNKIIFSNHLQDKHAYRSQKTNEIIRNGNQEIKKSEKRPVRGKKLPTQSFQENDIDKVDDKNVTTPPFKCHHCEKEFQRKIDLYYHMQGEHTTTTPIEHKCSFCALICKSKKEFIKHVYDEHYDNEETDSADSETYKCQYCDSRYYYKGHLKRHISEYHSEKLGQKKDENSEHKDENHPDNSDHKDDFYSDNSSEEDENHTENSDHKKIKKHPENSNRLNTLRERRFYNWIRRKAKTKNKLRNWYNKNRTLKCGHCQKEYLYTSYLIKHLQKFHGFSGASGLICDHCGIECRNRAELFKHIENHFGTQKDTDVQQKTPSILRKPARLQKQPGPSQPNKRGSSQEGPPLLRNKPGSSQEKHARLRNQPGTSQGESPHLRNQPDSSQEECVNFQELIDYDTEVQPLCIQKQPILQNTLSNTQGQSETIQDEYQYTREGYEYRQENWEYPQDESTDTGDETLDIQEEALDIKPEIFQCTQCPSSFLYEAEMMSHLQIIHGNILDMYMEKMKRNKETGKTNENTNDLVVENDKGQKECENIYKGYNFGELETNIKKEFYNSSENVELTDEQQLAPSLMSDVDPEFLERQYNINKYGPYGYDTELAKDYYPQEKTNPENENINWKAVTVKVEHLENDENQCGFECSNEDENSDSQIGVSTSYPNIEAIKCKCCQITFPNQEGLLDHMHELINKKAMLYAGAIQVFKRNNMQVAEPEIVIDEKQTHNAKSLN
ncbi:THAP domain-containing protein [Phthorimaea operculella]|nr:THAP domain-containing protein [Phthorimaea operculella]